MSIEEIKEYFNFVPKEYLNIEDIIDKEYIHCKDKKDSAKFIYNFVLKELNKFAERDNYKLITLFIKKRFIYEDKNNIIDAFKDLDNIVRSFEIKNRFALSEFIVKNTIVERQIFLLINEHIKSNKIDGKYIYNITRNSTLTDLLEIYCSINNIDIIEYCEDDKCISDNNFSLYLKDIEKYPLLTVEEEKLLAEKMSLGDTDARKKLILSNLRLVISVAKKYYNYTSIPVLDLIQEGNMGLMRAVDSFDQSKGFKLSTYSIWWIRQYITRHIYDKNDIIHKPIRFGDKIRKYNYVFNKLLIEEGVEPTDEQIIECCNLTMEDITEIKEIRLSCSSLNSYVGEDEEAELLDFISNEEDNEINNTENKIVYDSIFERIFKYLSPKEKDIIMMRFGLLDGVFYTLEESGKKYNITREGARQIELKAMRKLRKAAVIENITKDDLNSILKLIKKK